MDGEDSVPTAEPREAFRLQQEESAIVLDVREHHEWLTGHIPGAIHVPLGELPDRVSELPTDRSVIAACRSGARSERATRLLRSRGFDVTNLRGGTRAWHACGLPLEPSDGHVA